MDRGVSLGEFRPLDVRKNTAFRYYQTGSPFEYEQIRLLYTQKRALDILR